LKAAVYCSSAEVSEQVSDGSEIILYSASSQAPKSISLHRREQKGKNFISSDCFSGGSLTIFLQIGHLCFIIRYCFTFFEPKLKYVLASRFSNSKEIGRPNVKKSSAATNDD
jgi:hypothetical protein